MLHRLLIITLGLLVTVSAQAQSELPFAVEPVASFDEPWALAFLPDGRMLVTERPGRLRIVTASGLVSMTASICCCGV